MRLASRAHFVVVCVEAEAGPAQIALMPTASAAASILLTLHSCHKPHFAAPPYRVIQSDRATERRKTRLAEDCRTGCASCGESWHGTLKESRGAFGKHLCPAAA